ncbi:glycosyltransferase family 4 protein [Microbacterium sp. A84]|uniref:glycosyltransferase family 4 protein n=1 Tax=Microbacterium sp. A84 TaxID=3450715 RepID=UPI003F432507
MTDHNSSLHPRVTVLQSTNAPDTTTRYIDQVVTHASDDVEFVYFSWQNALLKRWDVLHVHWPEALMTSRRPLIRSVKAALLWGLIARARLLRRPIVRTLHNLEPHEQPSKLVNAAMRMLERNTTTAILINRQPVSVAATNTATILHGHYRERFTSYTRSPQIPGRVLFFGLIRPYKNVDNLVTAFHEIPTHDAHASLRVVGKADSETQQSLKSAADSDDRISFRFGYVEDDELVREITAASLVVLPYKGLYNSGVALAALSLGVPVLVPASAAGTELSEEVGDGWIYTFSDDLDAEQLAAAIRDAEASQRTTEPAMDGRNWDTVARQYEQVYRDAIDVTHRRK